MSLSTKTIVVVGGGSVGSTLAQSIVESKQAKKVLIAARDPAKTSSKLEGTGLEVLPMENAIAEGDILILATPSAQSDEAIEALAASLGNVDGKLIIDATNPLSEFAEGLEVRWKMGTSSGETLAKALPSAKVYKAFNTLGVEHMNRDKAIGTAMMYCGPDEDIKEVVAAVGFTPYYMGGIRYARNLEAIAELWIHCAIPPLPANNLGRDWTFAIVGNPDMS